MKKILFSIFVLFAFKTAVFADLWALRSWLEMLGQGSVIFNAKEVMAVPADGNGLNTAFSASLDFNGVFMFGGDDGIYALYVKKDHVVLPAKNTVVFSKAYNWSITNDEQWGIHYLGIGARKYFLAENWGVNLLLPYAAIDAGWYFTSNTVSKIYVKNSSGSILAAGEMEGTGGFLGMNVEGGADFWVMNDFAVTVKAGYRFCGGPVKSVKSAESAPFTGVLSDVYEQVVDYSGLYFQIGIAMNFQRYD